MYCKNCGNKLNDNDKFCTSCGTKIVNGINSSEISNKHDAKSINNNNNIEKNKKIINIICKILLIFNFISIVVELLDGEVFIVFPSVMLIATTIGILKTEQKKNNIFLILSIISIGLTIYLPIMVMFGIVFVILLGKLFGGFQDVSILDGILKTPLFILNMKGGISTEVVLIIIGISFLIIHKKQKFKNKK